MDMYNIGQLEFQLSCFYMCSGYRSNRYFAVTPLYEIKWSIYYNNSDIFLKKHKTISQLNWHQTTAIFSIKHWCFTCVSIFFRNILLENWRFTREQTKRVITFSSLAILFSYGDRYNRGVIPVMSSSLHRLSAATLHSSSFHWELINVNIFSLYIQTYIW